MERPLVLLVGHWRHRDFRDAVAWLEAHVELRRVETSAEAVHALSEDGGGFSAQLVVFAQSRPGQFRSSHIEMVHRSAPLARMVALLGSWCEGETRTGSPWPGVWRVYWHQWLARADRLLNLAPHGSWSLSRTAVDADQLVRDLDEPVPTGSGLLLIRSADAASFEMYGEVAAAAGYASVWQFREGEPAVRGVNAILWDGTSGNVGEAAEIGRLAARWPHVPLLVLLDYPRREDVDRVRRAGADAVVSKPFLVPDLWHQIAQLQAVSAPRRAASAA